MVNKMMKVMERLFWHFIGIGAIIAAGYFVVNWSEVAYDAIIRGVTYYATATDWLVTIWATILSVMYTWSYLGAMFDKIMDWIKSKKAEEVA